MILQENAPKPGVHSRTCIPLAIESANSLRFLWTALSIEGPALSIESAPFYRMAGFLGIPGKCSAFYRKRKFLESAEHVYISFTHVYLTIILLLCLMQYLSNMSDFTKDATICSVKKILQTMEEELKTKKK